MAHIYRRRKQFWICYYINGKRVQKSLNTDNERIAKDKKRQIEYQLSIGELHIASRLPLATTLEDFCRHLQTTRTRKSYKNDSRTTGSSQLARRLCRIYHSIDKLQCPLSIGNHWIRQYHTILGEGENKL